MNSGAYTRYICQIQGFKKPYIHKRALCMQKSPTYVRTVYVGQGGQVTKTRDITVKKAVYTQKSPIYMHKRALHMYAPCMWGRAAK